MISAIASSSRCSAPIKPPSHSSTTTTAYKVKRKKSLEDERRHSFGLDCSNRMDADNAKHISEKDREAFLSYGLFNIVAGKRTAELLEKQHRHEQCDVSRRGSQVSRRVSEPEILRYSTKSDFLGLPQTKEGLSNEKRTFSELSTNQHNLDVKPPSQKRSLKRIAKTTSRNLQEFFNKF